MTDTLKPCPCCGGAPHMTKGYATEAVWAHGDFHRVFCGVCQLRQLFYRTPEEAAAAWNRRPNEVQRGWCSSCGCGNEAAGYAHAPLCQRTREVDQHG